MNMNIDPSTLSLAIRIATAMQSHDTPTPPTDPLIGRKVLVRDHRAGVFCGELTQIDVQAGTATLTSARQIWYWTGAAATTGIAARGIGEDSKVCPTVEAVYCRDVVQVMPMTNAAWECVSSYPEWTP